MKKIEYKAKDSGMRQDKAKEGYSTDDGEVIM